MYDLNDSFRKTIKLLPRIYDISSLIIKKQTKMRIFDLLNCSFNFFISMDVLSQKQVDYIIMRKIKEKIGKFNYLIFNSNFGNYYDFLLKRVPKDVRYACSNYAIGHWSFLRLQRLSKRF